MDIVTKYFITAKNNFHSISNSVDSLQVTNFELYTWPFFRVLPYFTGVFYGWLMSELHRINFKLYKGFVVFAWCFSIFYVFQATYITCRQFFVEKYVPDIIAVALSIGKVGFAGSLGNVITLCYLGYGGFLFKYLYSSCLIYIIHINCRQIQ